MNGDSKCLLEFNIMRCHNKIITFLQFKTERSLSDYGGSEFDSTETNGPEITSSLNPILYKNQTQWISWPFVTARQNGDNYSYDTSSFDVSSGFDSGGHVAVHFDDTFELLADAFRPPVPRPGYICNICRVPGHYIQYCPEVSN